MAQKYDYVHRKVRCIKLTGEIGKETIETWLQKAGVEIGSTCTWYSSAKNGKFLFHNLVSLNICNHTGPPCAAMRLSTAKLHSHAESNAWKCLPTAACQRHIQSGIYDLRARKPGSRKETSVCKYTATVWDTCISSQIDDVSENRVNYTKAANSNSPWINYRCWQFPCSETTCSVLQANWSQLPVCSPSAVASNLWNATSLVSYWLGQRDGLSVSYS
jgi:hypothetical protein